jgi:hypothetical protein
MMLRDFKTRWDKWTNAFRLRSLTRQVANASTKTGAGTAVVFNASTRLGNLSLNAAYSLLISWGLRLEGWRVIHFVCQAGMSRCLLGSSQDDHTKAPPCQSCTALSTRMYAGGEVVGYHFQHDEALAGALQGLTTAELSSFEHDDLPLGALVLPSIRWRMRRHHLEDDEPTLALFREFIQSAHRTAVEFRSVLEREQPDLVLVFNGQMFPEAVVSYLARQGGIRTLTHETGYQPDTVYITAEDATARKIYLTEAERTLTPAQDRRLDEYLEQRFQGSFSMGGIQFWQEIKGLPPAVEGKLSYFERVVPIFTNVIFDTSQAHANRVYPHMFAWLDDTLELVRQHPETLFILRAHPDELRPNSRKQSRETVRGWVERTGADSLPNLVYIDSLEFVSSYDLIARASFVLAYNSSVALEAVMLGKPAVCAGWAWYAEYNIVTSPATPEDYRQAVRGLLSAGEAHLPEENRRLARSLVYYQNFRASLPFGHYLEPHAIRGYVRLLPFDVQQLSPQQDDAIQSILNGIRDQATVFTLPEEYYDN